MRAGRISRTQQSSVIRVFVESDRAIRQLASYGPGPGLGPGPGPGRPYPPFDRVDATSTWNAGEVTEGFHSLTGHAQWLRVATDTGRIGASDRASACPQWRGWMGLWSPMGERRIRKMHGTRRRTPPRRRIDDGGRRKARVCAVERGVAAILFGVAARTGLRTRRRNA